MLSIVVIFALLIVNGILAMAEIAIVSARRARLKQMAEKGSAGAQDALQLGDSPTQFFSTVQIGITLVGIFAGAFGGAALAQPLADVLKQLAVLAPYADQIAFLVIVLIITYFSLVIGELVPKQLGLANPEKIAATIAPPMRLVARIMAPLVFILTFSTNVVLKLLRVPITNEQAVTEEEIKILLDEGTAHGVFATTEREIVGRVFQFSDLHVSALMTPRTRIAVFDLQDSEETVRQKLAQHSHSRFPVVRGSFDNVLGIVKTRDLLAQHLAGQNIDLQAVMLPALFVPETMSALDLLEKFKSEETHIALVTDEYGGIQGVVTITDLTEAIVGDVPLSDEPADVEILHRADDSWLVGGRLPVHEFKAKLALEVLPHEADGHYQTVGGFVMCMLERIPRAGDRFEWDGWCAEVMDMDGRRVDKVLFQRKAP